MTTVSDARERSSLSEMPGAVIRHAQEERWARTCATAGAAAWAGLAVLARAGLARIGAIELVFLFAPLVIAPLGMSLGQAIGGGSRLVEIAQRVQPLGAACAVMAMCLPPGRWAGIAALVWMMVCLLLCSAGVMDLFSAPWSGVGRSVRWSLAIARIDLIVGGAWLVASRLGMRPMGIQEPIGLLTAVHFHFAGFATATITAAALDFCERRAEFRWLKKLAVLVVGMPFVVAAGFMISPALKMGAALVFSASVGGLGVILRSCARGMRDAAARVWLQVAAVAVFAGMVLSGVYAVANFLGSEVLTIPQMARTHGILNAVGFCLAGLLGWLLEGSSNGLGRRPAISSAHDPKLSQ